ncbi:hypothetical protein KCP69_16765 [Salmonella enterica subsp. enterica]|nr:hypothetical protein KCP69_16765 [Salmonella enterica subsp. enterica]
MAARRRLKYTPRADGFATGVPPRRTRHRSDDCSQRMSGTGVTGNEAAQAGLTVG